ncbi:MAG: phage shock protein operon transcriptional activator [Chitinispirillia bacterium]|jgi:psp operon transcriptional activator
MGNNTNRSNIKIQEARGQSDAFLEMQEKLSTVASVNRPLLILGERGTGKELAASRIHYLSNRWQNTFVTLNCSALSSSLLESELFGHEAGAFTGATAKRKGRFEMAHEGTLFLDEIGNMPMVVQEKILRVIEYSFFERVGGSVPIQVDVRIIAATNVDLPALAKKGEFKQDLLDRLSFEVVTLPPLRERKEDILLLAQHFAAQMAIELGLSEVPLFSDTVIEQLNTYDWPGNIRELKNVVERAVYQNKTSTLTNIIINPFKQYHKKQSGTDIDDLTKNDTNTQAPQFNFDVPLEKAIENIEIGYLQKALSISQYNQKRAAGLLGMTYNQFRGLFRKYKKTLNL